MGEFIETAFLLSIVGTFCLGAFFICMTALAVLDSTPSDTVMSDTIIADTSQQSPTTNEPVTLGDISKPTYKFSEPVSSTDVEYEGADGHTISFAHNSSAVNPTYEQVISFLKSDTTDQIPYDLNKFTCGDYAEHVQHNAEATGYRCGWVFIELDNGNHACNAFDTMDRGIVFVDSTIFDSVVDLKEGYEYQPIPLSKLLGYNSGVSADSMGVVKSYHIEW
ncbi:MAG TPA: hypothetical protein VGL27_17340 [Negativicutes bacterium]